MPAGVQYSSVNTQAAGQGHESPDGGYDVQHDRGYPAEIQGSQEYEQSGSRVSPRSYDGQSEQHSDREHATENAPSGNIQTRGGNVIRGENVTGNDMQNAYKENQVRLHDQSGQGFGPQNELQRQVAEQRSEIERNMNKSAGEIDKKQSTVQASSDILKGESLNATGKFNIERKEAEIDQQMPVIDSAERRKLEEQLLELRKRAG